MVLVIESIVFWPLPCRSTNQWSFSHAVKCKTTVDMILRFQQSYFRTSDVYIVRGVGGVRTMIVLITQGGGGLELGKS